MDSGAVRIACGIEVDGEDIGHGGPNMTWKKLTVNNCREWKPSKIMFFTVNINSTLITEIMAETLCMNHMLTIGVVF